MIPKINSLVPLENYKLRVKFDDGKEVIYDVMDDIKNIKDFEPLLSVYGLFKQVSIDISRTCVYWNDRIDLPSDTILEYGVPVQENN